MIIIGLMGPAGSGKSTAAEHLAEKYGAKRYALANPLKEIAARTLGFSEAQLWGTQAEKEAIDERYGFSARWFLQRLGTEGCREVLGQNVWVDALMREIQLECPRLAVVEDVRFANEAIAIRDAGGVVWRLECPERQTSDDGSHASESGYLDAPYDRMLMPEAYGVHHLHDMVDRAMASVGRDRSSR